MDLEGNFSTAEKYIRSAAEAACHIAVLPEFHLTSWAPRREGFLDSNRASTVYLAKYQDLARELDINIVPGTICEPCDPEEGASSDDSTTEWRNMAYFIAAGTGDICGAYQKKNLWHTERDHLSSSRYEPHYAFDTPLKHADGTTPVRVGMLICWDLAFPEAFRALVADGADMIIIPSWWYALDAGQEGVGLNPDSEQLFVESATTLRAFESNAAVVFCNAGGWSGVTMPVQGVLTRCGTGEEMRTAEVDLDVLRVAEEAYKIRKDLKSKDWHYGYEKRA